MSDAFEALDRTEIRRKTVEALLGATDAGERVYRTRRRPGTEDELPALLVYALDEEMTPSGDSGSEPAFDHSLTLAVEVVVSAGPDADEGLDRLCGQILDRLLRDPKWLDLAGDVDRIDTHTVLPKDGDRDYLGAVIKIILKYATLWPPRVPDVLSSARLGIGAVDPFDPNLAPVGPDGRIEVEAEIVVPTA